MNFADRLLAGKDASRPAVITLEAAHSYGELSATVSSVATFLLGAGAERGECVGIVADNSFFWVAAYLPGVLLVVVFAVVAVLAPICVDRFQRSADATNNFIELKKVSTYMQ